MRRRWLAIAVLGACHFSPGEPAATSDAPIGTTDTSIDSVLIDAPVTSPDASPDSTVVSPIKVRSITMTTKVQNGPHVNFPVLVSLTSAWLASTGNGGDVASTTGTDIYFSADQLGATRLAFDVESYDPVAGTLIAWVKVPALTATSVIYLHYGDATITTSQENVAGTWTASYKLVAHMDGSSDATGLNTVTSNSLTAATGQIGPAWAFDGTASYVSCGSGTDIDNVFTNGGTLEAWIYASTYGGGGFGRLFDKSQYALFVDNTNVTGGVSFFHDCDNFTGCYGQWHSAAITNPLTTWHHIAVTYDQGSKNNNPSFYVDGVAVTTTKDVDPSGSMVSDAAATLYVGARSDGFRRFDGNLDELRLSAAARSADWILTQYRNQADPATFYTVSAPL